MGVHFFVRKNYHTGGGVRGGFGKRPYFFRIFFLNPSLKQTFPIWFRTFFTFWLWRFCEEMLTETFLNKTEMRRRFFHYNRKRDWISSDNQRAGILNNNKLLKVANNLRSTKSSSRRRSRSRGPEVQQHKAGLILGLRRRWHCCNFLHLSPEN